MHILTEVQTGILEALATYKFLTHSQMVKLSLAHPSYLRIATKTLRSCPSVSDPLIDALPVSPADKIEGREQMFFLTPTGSETLGDILRCDARDFACTPRKVEAKREYWHRKYCVDVHIAMAQALAGNTHIELGIWHRYFEPGKMPVSRNNRPFREKTRIPLAGQRYFVPDLIFSLQSRQRPDAKAVYALEMVNGRGIKRILKQMYTHTVAMEQGAIPAKYGIPSGEYLALFLFSHRSTLEAVRKRFAEVRVDAGNFRHAFFFAHIEDAEKDVLRCWQKESSLGDGRYHFITGRKVDSP